MPERLIIPEDTLMDIAMAGTVIKDSKIVAEPGAILKEEDIEIIYAVQGKWRTLVEDQDWATKTAIGACYAVYFGRYAFGELFPLTTKDLDDSTRGLKTYSNIDMYRTLDLIGKDSVKKVSGIDLVATITEMSQPGDNTYILYRLGAGMIAGAMHQAVKNMDFELSDYEFREGISSILESHSEVQPPTI